MKNKSMKNVEQVKCACGGTMNSAEIELRGFKLKGFKCGSCGEEALNPYDVERVRLAQLKKTI